MYLGGTWSRPPFEPSTAPCRVVLRSARQPVSTQSIAQLLGTFGTRYERAQERRQLPDCDVPHKSARLGERSRSDESGLRGFPRLLPKSPHWPSRFERASRRRGKCPPPAGATGRITWDGVADAPPDRRAIVFQRPAMLRRSAASNLRYALKAAGVARDQHERRVDELARTRAACRSASRSAAAHARCLRR